MQTTSNNHQANDWTQDPSMYSWASPGSPAPSAHPGAGGAPVRESADNTEPAGEKPSRTTTSQTAPAPEEPQTTESAPPVEEPATTEAPATPASGRSSGHSEPQAPAPRRPEASRPSRPRPSADEPRDSTDSSPAPRPGPSPLDNSLVRPPREVPQHGWRRVVHQASFGLITPRVSEYEVKRREWIGTTNVNVPGATSITVASMKGGVGKTTVSSLLGLTLAQHRGDRVVALDANPDAGTLADRLLGVDVEGRRPTIRDLLNKRDAIEAGTQLNRFLGLAGRLAVLASEMDPAKSEMFNQSEYEAVACLIARFYDVLITDSGTGLVHSAMHGALNLTDGLVIVGAPTVDAANSAGRTLDWLTEHGFSELVSNAVVAISCDRGSPDVDRGRIHDHFASRCRAVVEIPADPHLSTGGQINLNALQQPTLDKALELSAHVAEGFHHHASSTLMKKAGLA